LPFEEQTVVINKLSEPSVDQSVEPDAQPIASESEIVGDDVIERLGDLFTEESVHSDEDELQPDLYVEEAIQHETSSQESIYDTFELEPADDVQEASFPAAANSQEPHVTSEEPAAPGADEDVLIEQDALSDSDVSDRIKDIFEPETMPQLLDTGMEEPSGNDIVGRIDDLFESPTSAVPQGLSTEDIAAVDGTQEEQSIDNLSAMTFQKLANQSPEPQAPAAGEDFFTRQSIRETDIHQVAEIPAPTYEEAFLPSEESIRNDVNETTFDQLLPHDNTLKELFAEPINESSNSESGDSSITLEELGIDKEEYVPSEFEETLQFDSVLFEKMLNPEIEEIPDTVSASEDGNRSDVAERDIFSTEQTPFAATTEDANVMAPENGLQANDSAELLGEEFVRDENALPPDLLAEEQGDTPTSNLTEDNYSPALIDDDQEDVPDLILDSTATFEVAPPERGQIDQYNNIIDFGNDSVNSVSADAASFSNRIISDKTEIFDIAPSGDDIVGKLESMFSETKPQEIRQTDRDERSDEVVDLTKEYLLDDLSEMNDEASEDEMDTALVETMQISEEPVASSEELVITSEEPVAADERTVIDNDVELSAIGEPGNEIVVDDSEYGESDGMRQRPLADDAGQLESFFSSPDLISLSSENDLPLEDDTESVNDAVPDFYTLSGEDAIAKKEPLPESIDQVEFTASDAIIDGRTVEMTKDQIDRALEEPSSVERQTTFSDEMLPGNEMFDDFPQETVEMSTDDVRLCATPVVDNRDKPFDIPDHVLTPTLADIYYQQGQYKLALQIFSRLLLHDPENTRLISRYNEIKALVDAGGSVATAHDELAQQNSGTKMKNHRKSTRHTTDPSDGERPLAGVHIKKRTKTTRKSSKDKNE
jgi:hypothetical protein